MVVPQFGCMIRIASIATVLLMKIIIMIIIIYAAHQNLINSTTVWFKIENKS